MIQIFKHFKFRDVIIYKRLIQVTSVKVDSNLCFCKYCKYALDHFMYTVRII